MNAARTAQIMDCERRLLDAMKTSDVALLDELLHDDLLFNGPMGETATKSLDLDNYRTGNIQLPTVDGSDYMIRLLGDTAVVAVTVTIRGSYLGEALDGAFRYLRVWQLADDRWRVIAGSVAPLLQAG